MREEVVDDCGYEFGRGVTGEARDDKTRVREAEVGEGSSVGAIEEARGARGGEKEEGALVNGDREEEACALSVDGVEKACEGGRGVRRENGKAVGVRYRSPEGWKEEAEGIEGLLA